jgi:hypothetical protein
MKINVQHRFGFINSFQFCLVAISLGIKEAGPVIEYLSLAHMINKDDPL